MFFNRVSSNKTETCSFEVELLEDRQMLSTVSISASGDVGDEVFQVSLNGDVLFSTQAVNGFNDYAFDVAGQIAPEDLRIEFVNDLFDPSRGIDRNLRVNSLTVDGATVDPFNNEVFSTGTWLPEDGVTAGFGRGNILHSNGFLQFSAPANSNPPQTNGDFQFVGRTWNVADDSQGQAFLDSNGEVVLNGRDGVTSVSSQFDVSPDALFEFKVEAYRDIISGSFASDASPWATAGVNLYDSSGQLVSQQTIEINGDSTTPGTVQNRVFNTGNAVTAYGWIWVDGTDAGTEIPLRVSDFSFAEVTEPSDTQAPQVGFTGLLNVPGNVSDEPIAFTITTSDNQDASVFVNSVRIVADNGFNFVLNGIAGGFDPASNENFERYTLSPPNEFWTAADNGTYRILLDQGQLSDISGNVTPAQELGSFVINIA